MTKSGTLQTKQTRYCETEGRQRGRVFICTWDNWPHLGVRKVLFWRSSLWAVPKWPVSYISTKNIYFFSRGKNLLRHMHQTVLSVLLARWQSREKSVLLKINSGNAPKISASEKSQFWVVGEFGETMRLVNCLCEPCMELEGILAPQEKNLAVPMSLLAIKIL